MFTLFVRQTHFDTTSHWYFVALMVEGKSLKLKLMIVISWLCVCWVSLCVDQTACATLESFFYHLITAMSNLRLEWYGRTSPHFHRSRSSLRRQSSSQKCVRPSSGWSRQVDQHATCARRAPYWSLSRSKIWVVDCCLLCLGESDLMSSFKAHKRNGEIRD